jgi:hypothetical protein
MLAAAFNIIANFIFVRFWGIWAALGSTYISFIIFGIGGLFNKENRALLGKYINVYKFCIGNIILNITLFIIAYLIKDRDYIFKLSTSILTVILSLFIFFKIVSVNVLKAIR